MREYISKLTFKVIIMSETKNTDKNQMLSDDTIIEMYWERNETAIKETDKKYGKYLYTISYNVLHDRLDCEECINDTYLSTWNRIPPTRPNMFQRFLSKITRDISVDKYRKTHTLRRIPSELVVSLDELDDCISCMIPESETETVEKIGAVLNSYLHGITERDRFIFVCRYYYSDTVQYIAKMVGVSDKTVYRELVRIRNGLREALLKEGIEI